MSDLRRAVLEHDTLTAGDRSVVSSEACWGQTRWHPRVPWGDAFAVAQERGNLPFHDLAGGRTVAFLEGMILGARVDYDPRVAELLDLIVEGREELSAEGRGWPAARHREWLDRVEALAKDIRG